MSRQERSCDEMVLLLVDHAEGALSAAAAKQVDQHCDGCRTCADSLAALREVPPLLRGEDGGAAELSAAAWQQQRTAILSAIDEVMVEEEARRAGFDARIFLPVAAALVIAVAGALSLWPVGGGGSGALVARAALSLELADPLVLAEVAEVVGEPLILPADVWDAGEAPDVRVWLDDEWSTEVSLDDLDDEEVLELEEMLG